MKKYELDEIDFKILNMLTKNGRALVKDMAAEVSLSSPAVSARIANMEEQGYITGYQVSVNPKLLGYHIKAFVGLEIDNDRKKECYSFIKNCRNVMECNSVTGEYSILLEVLFENTEGLEEFVDGLSQYGKAKTQIVFSTAVERRGVEFF